MKTNLSKNYNKLTPSEKRLLRLEYIKQQDNKCWFCKNDLNEKPSKEIAEKFLNLGLFPKGFLNSPIHLQHDHKTGLTEGAVHAYCNGILWQYFNK